MHKSCNSLQKTKIEFSAFEGIVNPYDFAKRAVQQLKTSNTYGEDFVKLHVLFFNRYQNGLIFSTNITASYFENIIYWLPRIDFIPVNGEYDRNFNDWLKHARSKYQTTQS